MASVAAVHPYGKLCAGACPIKTEYPCTEVFVRGLQLGTVVKATLITCNEIPEISSVRGSSKNTEHQQAVKSYAH